MSMFPADLRYTKSHEWLRTLPDGSIEIGITDHAQQSLGDLVFVEVPERKNARRRGCLRGCRVREGGLGRVQPVRWRSDGGKSEARDRTGADQPRSLRRGLDPADQPAGGKASAETLDAAAYEAVVAAGG